MEASGKSEGAPKWEGFRFPIMPPLSGRVRISDPRSLPPPHLTPPASSTFMVRLLREPPAHQWLQPPEGEASRMGKVEGSKPSQEHAFDRILKRDPGRC